MQNTGFVATRYARAFLRFVDSRAHSEEVYARVQSLLSGTVEGPFGEDLESLVSLLVRNGRGDCLKETLLVFSTMYRESRHIRLAHLVTAVPAPEVEQRLRNLLEARTGCTVSFTTEVDPDIIGGFIFTMDDRRLDASVSRQIELLRRKFIQKNNRIV